jgi:hypothetical protein
MEDWRVMSETSFPVNDLIQKIQTTIVSLTAVLPQLFPAAFSSEWGWGNFYGQNTLTLGYRRFLAGSSYSLESDFHRGCRVDVIHSVSMMTQRTGFRLIKAAGCPNSLVFGYFMTELLIVTFAGCALGVLVGFGVDFAVSSLSSFDVYKTSANIWFAPVVFAAFLALALIFGTKPILY